MSSIPLAYWLTSQTSSYELQITQTSRRNGLGTRLMECLEAISKNWKMDRMKLTALKSHSLHIKPGSMITYFQATRRQRPSTKSSGKIKTSLSHSRQPSQSPTDFTLHGSARNIVYSSRRPPESLSSSLWTLFLTVTCGRWRTSIRPIERL